LAMVVSDISPRIAPLMLKSNKFHQVILSPLRALS
jgi:hypothetical protein